MAEDPVSGRAVEAGVAQPGGRSAGSSAPREHTRTAARRVRRRAPPGKQREKRKCLLLCISISTRAKCGASLEQHIRKVPGCIYKPPRRRREGAAVPGPLRTAPRAAQDAGSAPRCVRVDGVTVLILQQCGKRAK